MGEILVQRFLLYEGLIWEEQYEAALLAKGMAAKTSDIDFIVYGQVDIEVFAKVCKNCVKVFHRHYYKILSVNGCIYEKGIGVL